MLSIRACIKFLEVALGFTLGILQMEGMKEEIAPTEQIITNTALSSMLVTFMFRFEITLFSKEGFFKGLDMVFTIIAASAYGIGIAMQYRGFEGYLEVYKIGGSLATIFVLLIDTLISWGSAVEEDEFLPRRGSRLFYLVVARQNQLKPPINKAEQEQRQAFMITGISRAEADVWYSKPRFMRPWGKVYTRVQDEEVTEEKLKQKLTNKLGRDRPSVLTPQERLLRAIEMKREIAAALREQRRGRMKSTAIAEHFGPLARGHPKKHSKMSKKSHISLK